MSDAHQSIGIERCCRELQTLHEHVTRNWGRIEISREDAATGAASDETCILISKAELNHIERALEIFCDMPQFKSVCEELTRIAEQSTQRAQGAGIDDSNGDTATLTDPARSAAV